MDLRSLHDAGAGASSTSSHQRDTVDSTNGVLVQDPTYLYKYLTAETPPAADSVHSRTSNRDQPTSVDSDSKVQSLEGEARSQFVQRVVRDPLLQRSAGLEPLIASLRNRRMVSPVALDRFFEATVLRLYDESFEAELAATSATEEGLMIEFMLADLPLDDARALREGALISGVTAHDLTRRWGPTKVTALHLRRTRAWEDQQISAAALRGAEIARRLVEYDGDD
jgi:hypothetical protein